MYTVIFRSLKRADMDADAYREDNARMFALATSQPGFVSVKTFAAEDGETVSISIWESREAAKGWGRHPDHTAMMARGRARYYASYSIRSFDGPPGRAFESELA